MEQGWLPEEGAEEAGCAYLVDIAEGRRPCAMPLRPGSSYCARHHALCHIAAGSAAEARRLRQIEAFAGAVGGRRARRIGRPPRPFLARLERLGRVFSRPDRS